MGKHKKPFKPSSKEFEVGYGRPPKASQFKAGQPSANPSGKRKGTKNRATRYIEFMEEKITIFQSGKARRLTREEALDCGTFNVGVKGNLKAAMEMKKELAEARAQCGQQAYPTVRTITDDMTPRQAAEAWGRLIARDN
jgi:hypothetical protein